MGGIVPLRSQHRQNEPPARETGSLRYTPRQRWRQDFLAGTGLAGRIRTRGKRLGVRDLRGGRGASSDASAVTGYSLAITPYETSPARTASRRPRRAPPWIIPPSGWPTWRAAPKGFLGTANPACDQGTTIWRSLYGQKVSWTLCMPCQCAPFRTTSHLVFDPVPTCCIRCEFGILRGCAGICGISTMRRATLPRSASSLGG
jgi:hypothetical protein